MDRALVEKRRGDANRLGFSIQLGTVRCLGAFLADPVDVPTPAVDYMAAQLGVGDPSCLKAYSHREKTRLEHQWKIVQVYGYRDFASAEEELSAWIGDRAWTTGEGPRALFGGAVAWLRERRVLLPGLSVLTRLVASVREAATQRLWETLAAKPAPAQARLLDRLLDVPPGGPPVGPGPPPEGPDLAVREGHGGRPGARRGDHGPGPVRCRRRRHPATAPGAGPLGHGRQGAGAAPPSSQAPDGHAAGHNGLSRSEGGRRRARTVRRAHDEQAAGSGGARNQPRQRPTLPKGRPRRRNLRSRARRATRIESAESDPATTLEQVWEAVDAVVSRSNLRAAVANLTATLPPPDTDVAGEWRAELIERYAVVRSFVPQLCRAIEFGATAEAAPVLDALRELPELLEARATKRAPAGWLDAARIAADVVPVGWWRRLVFPPGRPEGAAHRAAYVFCVLEQLHQRLRRRNVYASGSTPEPTRARSC